MSDTTKHRGLFRRGGGPTTIVPPANLKLEESTATTAESNTPEKEEKKTVENGLMRPEQSEMFYGNLFEQTLHEASVLRKENDLLKSKLEEATVPLSETTMGQLSQQVESMHTQNDILISLCMKMTTERKVVKGTLNERNIPNNEVLERLHHELLYRQRQTGELIALNGHMTTTENRAASLKVGDGPDKKSLDQIIQELISLEKERMNWCRFSFIFQLREICLKL